MNLTIYHNPACSKSRKTLELIEEHGIIPNIIEYLKRPPDAVTVRRLAQQLGIGVAEMLRPNEADYHELTHSVSIDDEQALAEGLAVFPGALQRPIVVDEDSGKTVIGRPPENVLDLMAK